MALQRSSTTKVLLLAAGQATRLRPITLTIPKCLVPISGRPLLDQWVAKALRANLTDISINTRHLRGYIRKYLDWVRRYPLLMTERYETDLLGSAGTVRRMIEDHPQMETLVVIYADTLSSLDLGRFLEYHHDQGAGFTIATFKPDVMEGCGAVHMCGNTVSKFVEKGDSDAPWANAGVYAIDRKHFPAILQSSGDDMAHHVLPQFVGKMVGYAIANHVDIGTMEAYNANRQFPIDKLPGYRKAVFFDRDGTLMPDYMIDRRVEPYADAASCIQRLNEAGYMCFIVTNQGWIHRGTLSLSEVQEANEALCKKLAVRGAWVDDCYLASDEPVHGDEVIHYNRKPGPGMLVQAAIEHGVDLSESYMVGDRRTDILAGMNAGCKANYCLPREDVPANIGIRVNNLTEVADAILGNGQALNHR